MRSTGLIAVSLDDDDELAWVRSSHGQGEIILVTRNGKAIRFSEEDVRPMGRPAAGVIGIRMDDDDTVVAAEIVDPNEDDVTLLTVSTHGLGKRTELEEYRQQGRGGQGVIAMKLPDDAHIAGAAIVADDADVMLISSEGVVIRIPASQISTIGRATQGVSVMKVATGTEVVSMTVFTESEQVEIEIADSPNGVEPTNGREPSA